MGLILLIVLLLLVFGGLPNWGFHLATVAGERLADSLEVSQ